MLTDEKLRATLLEKTGFQEHCGLISVYGIETETSFRVSFSSQDEKKHHTKLQ